MSANPEQQARDAVMSKLKMIKSLDLTPNELESTEQEEIEYRAIYELVLNEGIARGFEPRVVCAILGQALNLAAATWWISRK
jgi:hypothetical protein